MNRSAASRWATLSAALACYACTGHSQVLSFSPLLRAQCVVGDPYERGWGVELGVGDSATTWWGSLHYARASGRRLEFNDAFEVGDDSRWLGAAGGLVGTLTRTVALEYGLHMYHVKLDRSVPGNGLNWIGTAVKGSALATGATARLRIHVGEVASLYIGADVGYRSVLEQRIVVQGPVDRPFSDAPYVGLLAGLKLRLQ